ncbi:MAG TPA: hypothetical protein VEY09_15465 [Pyrinomonadaceae bacterium]|nr:hypothetical protein [Pyrinomonadaceae bacterium]
MSEGPEPSAGGGREPVAGAGRHLAYEEARLAYAIIQSLLTHTQVTQDLIALMARVLDRETQDALVNTPNWSAYMDSRRTMEQTRADIERFAEVWTRLAEEVEPPPATEAATPAPDEPAPE